MREKECLVNTEMLKCSESHSTDTILSETYGKWTRIESRKTERSH